MFGSVAVAIGLSVATGAYACTVFAGKLTVTQSGSTTGYNTGDPNGDMTNCAAAPTQTGGVVRGTSFVISAAPADVYMPDPNGMYCSDSVTGTNQLPDVSWNSQTMYYTVLYTHGSTSHCMGDPGSTVGSISGSDFTLSGGAGSSGNLTITTGQIATGAGKICIEGHHLLNGFQVWSNWGSEVPVSFS